MTTKRSNAVRKMSIGSLLAAGCLTAMPSQAASTIVRFDTNQGNIDVRLYDTATPNSVANFLNYVTTDRYDGTFIHRVPQVFTGSELISADFVVQGGGFLLNDSIFDAEGIVTDDPIGPEPGLTNIRGTLAFAQNPLGATSQWFFNIGDNGSLDEFVDPNTNEITRFTVFGHVIRNTMPVVDAINDLRTINAAVAQDVPGEDFDEVPVTDFDQVLAINDITSNEAVIINSIDILNFAAGDYDFNGTVDHSDYEVWLSQNGSSVLVSDRPVAENEDDDPPTPPLSFAEADGNGDGVVNLDDYIVWRDAAGVVLGDMDGDGSLTDADISSFVQALTDPTSYSAENPELLPEVLGDFSGDNQLTNADIGGFVNALQALNINTSSVPEPGSLALLGLGGLLLARRRSA